MKKIIALLLVMATVLCGCGTAAQSGGEKSTEAPQQTTAAATEAPAVTEAAAEETQSAETTEATEAATEPAVEETQSAETEGPKVYFDPLNGEILDAPFDGRIYMNPVSNTNDGSIPHVGVDKADILMEMYVNGSIVRLLALFSDVEDVQAIGSTRSTRLMFNDICQHYNAILTHAGGDSRVLEDARNRGIVNFNIDSIMRGGDPVAQGTAYRDEDHPKIKYGEYNLYGIGPGIKAYVQTKDVPVSGMPETDYGFVFADDGTPADGLDAEEITITLTFGQSKKDTVMIYDPSTGKYVFNQYGQQMNEMFTGEPEAFENVIVMYTTIEMNGPFHQADFTDGGLGYYACNGKIVPIYWTCAGEDQPFRFYTNDAQPLAMGRGNSYIAVCSADSSVVWTPEPPVEETSEAVAANG